MMAADSYLPSSLTPLTATRYFMAGSADSDARLDRWLSEQLPDHSRSEIQRWIKESNVRVNGSVARANHRLAPGDAVEVLLPPPAVETHLLAQAIPLDILFEDADLLVVNKPAGMVVHPAPGHEAGTLVNAVLHHVPDLIGIGGEKRPGIVHRLDKDTSGVMVVAKHDQALRDLQDQFKRRQVFKQYMALAEGKVKEDSGRIIAPLGRHPTDRKRQAVLQPRANEAKPKARQAVTEYVVTGRYAVRLQNDLGHGNFTLLHAHPITGRTHQIRVHFAWLGHPLVGDPLYGLRQQRLRVPRLFLHAANLRFALPSSGEEMTFTAPLPPDLQAMLDQLAAQSS